MQNLVYLSTCTLNFEIIKIMLFSVLFQNLKRLSLEIKLRNRLGRTIWEIHVHCIEENFKNIWRWREIQNECMRCETTSPDLIDI